MLQAVPPSRFEKASSMDKVRLRQLTEIEKIQTALGNMHKSVSEKVTRSRKHQVEAHNHRTNLKDLNIEIGDFILIRGTARESTS